MFVYVTYDPIYEKILCVHDKPNQFCDVCRPVFKKREREKSMYQIYEEKRKVKKFLDLTKPRESNLSPELQIEIQRIEKLGVDLLEKLKEIKEN